MRRGAQKWLALQAALQRVMLMSLFAFFPGNPEPHPLGSADGIFTRHPQTRVNSAKPLLGSEQALQQRSQTPAIACDICR